MKKKIDIVPLVNEFLEKENLLECRKHEAHKFLNKNFSAFKETTDRCIELLNKLALEKPQEILDILNETISSEIYTTIIANSDKNKIDLYKKITSISMHWEIAPLFKLAAYLLSDSKAPLISLNEKKAIYSHCKVFGLDSKMIYEIRIIRNAKNHKFTLKGKSILLRVEDRNIQIPFARINEIYKTLEIFSSWWLTFIITQIYYSPIFGILAIFSFYKKAKLNKDFIQEYSDGLKILFPNLEKVTNPKKHLTVKKKVQMFYSKMKRKTTSLFKKDENYHKFLMENKEYYLERLSHHSKIILTTLQGITENLKNEVDKQYFSKLVNWFLEFNKNVSTIDLEEFEKIYIAKFPK